MDGGYTWAAINRTKHTVYVTLGDPLTSANQETVFYLGCENQGTQTDTATVANTIFNEFTSLNVCRVSTTTGMTYWAITPAAASANPNCFPTAGLLANGGGRCGAWANFLADIFGAQGFTGVQIENINPLDGVPSANFTGAAVMVKNATITSSTTYTRLPGIPAQSNPKYPQATFSKNNAHGMVGFMGTLYDPSYGKSYSGSSMNASRRAWEDASVAALIVTDTSGNLQLVAHVAGVEQTTMTASTPTDASPQQ
jgi:hypothetical protein